MPGGCDAIMRSGCPARQLRAATAMIWSTISTIVRGTARGLKHHAHIDSPGHTKTNLDYLCLVRRDVAAPRVGVLASRHPLIRNIYMRIRAKVVIFSVVMVLVGSSGPAQASHNYDGMVPTDNYNWLCWGHGGPFEEISESAGRTTRVGTGTRTAVSRGS